MSSAACALADGTHPARADLCRRETYVEQAAAIAEQTAGLADEAADIVLARDLPLTLKNLLAVQNELTAPKERSGQDKAGSRQGSAQGQAVPEQTDLPENLRGRRLLEEVRLTMTVEANLKLLRRGFQIDTAPLEKLIEKLREAKLKLETQSVILHVATKKGKGYSFCEENPEATHGISISSSKQISDEYSQVFGDTLSELAEKDERIIAVTAAMTTSLGLGKFFEKFPDRSVDVGICEEHATILCSAMATQGLKPYYAVYSTFLQRSFDEILIDICSQKLPVTLCIDRAGISGSDGETHQGVFDLSFLSFVPNLTIAVPKDIEEFKDMLRFSVGFDGPLAIRYPREGKHIFERHEKIERGKWEILKAPEDKAVIIACGERMINLALAAERLLSEYGTEVGVINARFVKPLDTELLDKLECGLIVTLEDNALLGGFGSLVDTYFCESKRLIKNFAYSDEFIPQGSVDELMRDYGINLKDICDYIKNACG